MQNYMTTTNEQIQQFMALALEGPMQMLNQIKFKQEGGAETYQAYFDNTRPVLEAVGGKMIFQAQGRHTVIGDQHWDLVFIIEFPNKEAFLAMLNNETFKAGAHLRSEAIVDSRLICMQAPDTLI
jgi:uncharacterized protein (DUF1330 family)